MKIGEKSDLGQMELSEGIVLNLVQGRRQHRRAQIEEWTKISILDEDRSIEEFFVVEHLPNVFLHLFEFATKILFSDALCVDGHRPGIANWTRSLSRWATKRFTYIVNWSSARDVKIKWYFLLNVSRVKSTIVATCLKTNVLFSRGRRRDPLRTWRTSSCIRWSLRCVDEPSFGNPPRKETFL